MLSRDELIRTVAQSCGVSAEVSTFFFEAFVNRLSNKLKPGDLLHFHNHGFFHKRNCRIQIEKTSESPTPKSYLIQLILFSSSAKIRSDLSNIHFLKIPNLKTLWIDDKEFQKNLNAGDFAPYNERNQLIKSFATKAEVIISGLRKDYDSELVEELTIPLTFDLNFLVKRSQKSSTSGEKYEQGVRTNGKTGIDDDGNKAKKEQLKKIKPVPGTKEAEEAGLPWSYGTKFLETENTSNVSETKQDDIEKKISDRSEINNRQRDSWKDQTARLKDFEPVPSHSILPKEEVKSDQNKTAKFNVDQNKSSGEEHSESPNKFTEVRSRTESYRLKSDIGRYKKAKQEKYPSIRSTEEKAFTARRNYLPIVAVAAFVIIVLAVTYIYFFRDTTTSSSVDINFASVKPPPNVNLIERNYDFAVTYPYPKMDGKVELSGINRDQLFSSDLKPVIMKEVKPEIKQDVTSETKIADVVKVENPTVIKEEATSPSPPVIEEKTQPVKEVNDFSNRIFLYRGFYVVYIGTYKSEDVADREADKYFDLGYNAIIEVVENRGRGLEYKLNVGDFTSEEFAKQFLEKYLK